jgi:endonuclease G
MAQQSDRFTELVGYSRAARDDVRRKVAAKEEAEPDPKRRMQYDARRAVALSGVGGAEAIVGDDDLQAAWFLPAGAQVRRSVGFVELSDGHTSTEGSGFLISPHLFLTNQHVIADAAAAARAQVTFDREIDETGALRPTSIFRLAPERLALFSGEEELDYAVVAVGDRIAGEAALDDLAFCILSDSPDKHKIGMNVNIIQHPSGMPKMIAVRNNILQYRTDRTLLYETDTETGSSGSPVLNDEWQVVALHHYGSPFLERNDENGRPIPVNVNEGVRISAIYRDLAAKAAALSADARPLLQQALAYDKQTVSNAGVKRLSPPRAHPEAERTTVRDEGAAMNDPTSSNTARIVVPLEITVRLGGAGGVTAAPAVQPAVTSAPQILRAAAEAIKVDEDYSNRSGYDPRFIPGAPIPLPHPSPKLAKKIAPLRPGEANAASGELKYEHFSIKMHKTKRLAVFTATNIDGETYLHVDRTTGQVVGAEGERWFNDPRISASFFIDQTFYSGWSNLFDRGHLTRRDDPNWGTADEAERANADTYHFTNCSPQHFRFNESAKFWQGAERYVLENGVLSADPRRRLCVFQGPIFDDRNDRMADDVQVPSAFYKVVVWDGADGLKSVGLVVDQSALLDEQRGGGLGKPRDLPSVNVSQWRVSIPSIEARTGLDFGEAVRGADTIEQKDQPNVGEALRAVLITTEDGLLPDAVKRR